MPPRRPAPNATWESSLHALQLTGTLYCQAELSAPWGIAIPDLDDVMMFGILTEGAAWLKYGRHKRAVRPGGLWLFPRGRAHRVCSDPSAPVARLEDLPVRPVSERYETLHYGGGGQRTKVTYGVVQFDEVAGRRLVASLPDIIHIDTLEGAAQSWLRQTVELITEEASSPQLGGDTVLTRLADVVVIQAIRAWLRDSASQETGWLAALRDGRIGQAVAALHREPGQDWTLERLARVAGMSRSVFAERFSALVGDPAMTYLTWVRMETARARLRDTDQPLIELAESLGYQSEAAFGRTFKRVVGVSPGLFRRSSRAGL